MRSLILISAVSATVHLHETFPSAKVPSHWVVTEDTSKEYGKWAVSAGKFFADATGSLGLQTTEDAKFYSISTRLSETLDTSAVPLIVQFSVKHEQSIDCGGGYVKLMERGFEGKEFNGDTQYAVMFGPDICGSTSKTHVILSVGDKNYLIEETLRAENDQLTRTFC